MAATFVVYALVFSEGKAVSLLSLHPTRAAANAKKEEYPEKIRPRVKVRRGALRLFNT